MAVNLSLGFTTTDVTGEYDKSFLDAASYPAPLDVEVSSHTCRQRKCKITRMDHRPDERSRRCFEPIGLGDTERSSTQSIM